MSDPTFGIGIEQIEFDRRCLYPDKGALFLQSARDCLEKLGLKECLFDLKLLKSRIQKFEKVTKLEDDQEFVEQWAQIELRIGPDLMRKLWAYHLNKFNPLLPRLMSIEVVPDRGWIFVFDQSTCFEKVFTVGGEQFKSFFGEAVEEMNAQVWWDGLSENEFWDLT
tara:strand:- start:304 stop:801 length:498 start_codon:yes stop_codon:yes gene_type:complete